jgi:hypothetical protein
MTPTDRWELTAQELDAAAWRFLRSEFASRIYADWPLDRRIDAFLSHYGPVELRDDGSAHTKLIDHVMANIRAAMRRGVLQRSDGADRS